MVGANPHMSEPYFNLGNNQSDTTTDIVENVPPKLVFWLSFSRYGDFWGKHFKGRIRYPISHRKCYIHFCRLISHEKWSCPTQNYFSLLFWKICIFFFLKKFLYEKYSKPHFLQKSSCWFLSPDAPFPSKWSCLPTNGFTPFPSKWSCLPTNGSLQFFQHKLKNICEVFRLESVLIWKKILRKINFILGKFSPNALFFKKLQNECKNSSFLHKLTSIRLDHAGAVAKFHIHGFIL